MELRTSYDVITVGGGLAGASLAFGLAQAGLQVLVLEREERFKDRVRGEQIHPWGVAELESLGLYRRLQDTCGHALPWFDISVNDQPAVRRNLVETTPQRAPEFSFFHPAMQEVVLHAAAEAGADVLRGTRPLSLEGGSAPRVSIEHDGHTVELRARLIVGADGRTSSMRNRGGFEVRRDRDHSYRIVGVLLDDMPIAEDTSLFLLNPDAGSAAALFPQGGGKVRAYLPTESSDNFATQDGFRLFAKHAARPGAPAEVFEGARPIGPIATFDTTDTWVVHPYRDGIVLIGDAAASNDPCLGEGLSLTARDARVLRDHLLASDDWDAAADAYAAEHDRYWKILFDSTQMYHRVFYESSQEARALRARALPRLAEDPTRIPDHLFTGPDQPITDDERRHFFGED